VISISVSQNKKVNIIMFTFYEFANISLSVEFISVYPVLIVISLNKP
jgi:hypothetical protein